MQPNSTTITPLNALIAALREELTQYGEMLARLDQQQDCAVSRMADELLGSVALVQSQATLIQAARVAREKCQRDLARELGIAEVASFVEIIPLLPADYRPLVQSLVEENNSLLRTVRQRAQQNHLLLSRSVEMMQDFMGALFPSRETQVYDDRGNRLTHSLPAPPLYEAVG